MFDISFGQLLLVLVIGLIVLGPKRLPIAIKTVIGWINALRRISNSVQSEINKELKLQALQDSLHDAEKKGIAELSPDVKSSIDELKNLIKKELNSAMPSQKNTSQIVDNVQSKDDSPQ